MNVKHVCMTLVLGAAAAVAGCQKDTTGVLAVIQPLAGLRYFDAVLDTGYMDMRLVDIVSYAPNSVRARFRTGGDPGGISNGNLSPPFLPVMVGAHDIRVFLDSTDLTTATTQMFDTTVTFAAGWNYTFILYGSARAKTLHAMVVADTAMALPADNSIWVRSIHLGTDTTGLGASVDVYAIPQANTPAAPPTIAASAFPAKSAYVRVPVGSLKAVLTRAGTLTAVTGGTANFNDGVVGTTTVDRIPGALVKNTAFSVVVLPRSTNPTMPFTYANPGVFILIDQLPPSTVP